MEIGIEVYEAQCASSSPKANVISSSLGRLAKTEDTAKYEDTAKTRVCYASM